VVIRSRPLTGVVWIAFFRPHSSLSLTFFPPFFARLKERESPTPCLFSKVLAWFSSSFFLFFLSKKLPAPHFFFFFPHRRAIFLPRHPVALDDLAASFAHVVRSASRSITLYLFQIWSAPVSLMFFPWLPPLFDIFPVKLFAARTFSYPWDRSHTSLEKSCWSTRILSFLWITFHFFLLLGPIVIVDFDSCTYAPPLPSPFETPVLIFFFVFRLSSSSVESRNAEFCFFRCCSAEFPYFRFPLPNRSPIFFQASPFCFRPTPLRGPLFSPRFDFVVFACPTSFRTLQFCSGFFTRAVDLFPSFSEFLFPLHRDLVAIERFETLLSPSDLHEDPLGFPWDNIHSSP